MLHWLAQTGSATDSAVNVLRGFWLFIGLAFMVALGALFIRMIRRSVQRTINDDRPAGKTKQIPDAWAESSRRLDADADSPADEDIP